MTKKGGAKAPRQLLEQRGTDNSGMRPRVLQCFDLIQETLLSVRGKAYSPPFCGTAAKRTLRLALCAAAGGFGDSRTGHHEKTVRHKVPHRRGDPYGNRTHVFAVRGRCLSLLTNGPCPSDWRNIAIIARACGKCQYLFWAFCKKVKNGQFSKSVPP